VPALVVPEGGELPPEEPAAEEGPTPEGSVPAETPESAESSDSGAAAEE